MCVVLWAFTFHLLQPFVADWAKSKSNSWCCTWKHCLCMFWAHIKTIFTKCVLPGEGSLSCWGTGRPQVSQQNTRWDLVGVSTTAHISLSVWDVAWISSQQLMWLRTPQRLQTVVCVNPLLPLPLWCPLVNVYWAAQCWAVRNLCRGCRGLLQSASYSLVRNNHIRGCCHLLELWQCSCCPSLNKGADTGPAAESLTWYSPVTAPSIYSTPV